MTDKKQVIFDIERCICHVPDACRDCSHYGHGEVIGCMEELLTDALALLKGQDNCENCAIAIEDRQPVIRCKNCKHGKINICDEFTTCYNVDSCLYGNKRKSNWWCADGERK